MMRSRCVPVQVGNHDDSWSIKICSSETLTCKNTAQCACTRSLPSWIFGSFSETFGVAARDDPDEVDGYRSPPPGDRVGVLDRVGGFVDQLGVLVDDEDERGHVFGWFPHALAVLGEERGSGFEDFHRVIEEASRLILRRGPSAVAAVKSPRSLFDLL